MLVVVATIGTTMMDGTVIKPGKLLGEVSNGTCCSPKELGIKIEYPPHHLLELEDVEIGQDFFSLKDLLLDNIRVHILAKQFLSLHRLGLVLL